MSNIKKTSLSTERTLMGICIGSIIGVFSATLLVFGFLQMNGAQLFIHSDLFISILAGALIGGIIGCFIAILSEADTLDKAPIYTSIIKSKPMLTLVPSQLNKIL